MWCLLMYTGDNSQASKRHNSLVRYFEYFVSTYNATGLALFPHNYGDWEPPIGIPKANGSLTSSFSFMHDLMMLHVSTIEHGMYICTTDPLFILHILLDRIRALFRMLI